jgi:hypothetical protein
MSDVYLGNPLLKKANTPIEFTQEQIEEFIKCQSDPVYFAKNYVKIVTLDKGLQPFAMYTSVRCHDRLVSLQLWYHFSYIMLFLMIMLI